MEQRAKERLTGGIILVALLVLLVPELLSDPSAPPPPNQPPDQAPLRSYTVNLDDGSQRGSAPVAASTQSIEPAPSPAQAGVTSAPAEAQPERAPAEPVPPSAVVDSEPEPPPPVPQSTAVTRTHRQQPAVHHQPAAAHLQPAAAGETRSGLWTVQLGVFSSHANAQRLAATLEHKGFAVKVAEIGPEGHRRYRVRAGSAHDRAGARRLLARLKAAGERGGDIVPPYTRTNP